MKCNKCHINDATIKKQVKNDKGEFEIIYLCHSCLNNENIQSAFKTIDIASFLKEEPKTSNNVLDGFMSVDGKKFMKKIVCCQVCGQTELDIKNSGLPGCSNCYSVFKPEMDAAIKEFQQTENLKHTGKANFSKRTSNGL